jgi:hypothetical protein
MSGAEGETRGADEIQNRGEASQGRNVQGENEPGRSRPVKKGRVASAAGYQCTLNDRRTFFVSQITLLNIM